MDTGFSFTSIGTFSPFGQTGLLKRMKQPICLLFIWYTLHPIQRPSSPFILKSGEKKVAKSGIWYTKNIGISEVATGSNAPGDHLAEAVKTGHKGAGFARGGKKMIHPHESGVDFISRQGHKMEPCHFPPATAMSGESSGVKEMRK